MRLTRIDLKQFRSFGESSIELADLTHIVGQNHVGKSSLRDAIEFCLSGRTRGTDDAGRNAKALIRAGQDRASVALTFSDGYTLTRVVLPTGTKVLPPDGGGWNRALVRLLVDGSTFLDLPHAEAKALLLALLDVRVPIGSEALPLDEVEARYQAAFEKRRQAKADLAAIAVPVKPEGDEAPNVPQLEAALMGLRAKKEELIAEQAGDGAARRAAQRQAADLQARLNAARASLAQFPADLDDQVARLEERAAIAGDGETEDPSTLAALKSREDTARTRAAALEAALAIKRDTVASLKDHQPSHGCVLQTDIPCRTAASAFSGYLAKLRKEIEDGEQEYHQVTADAAAAARELRALQDGLEAARKARQEAERAVTQAKAQAERRALIAQEVADLEVQVKGAELALAQIRVATAENPEIAKLAERISKGEQVVQAARRWAADAEAYQSGQKRQQAAAKKVADLEALVEQLGPKGARVAALGAALGGFTAAVNQALAVFGYALEFSLDPWGVLVNGRSAALLSRSERLIVGVALQLAVAKASGLDFAVIDEADTLNDVGRAQLSGLVQAFVEGGGQLVICATKDSTYQAPPSGDGWAVYVLTMVDGVTRATRTPRANEAAA